MDRIRHFLIARADDMASIQAVATTAADGVFLDLEDGVPAARKEQARANVAQALGAGLLADKATMVRLNQVGSAEYDHDFDVLAGQPDVVLLPKVCRPEEVEQADRDLATAERRHGIQPGRTQLFVMIETAEGLLRAFDLFRASPRVTGVQFGVADLTLELGSRGLSAEGIVLDPIIEWAGFQTVVAARAAGLRWIITSIADCRVDDAVSVERAARQRFRSGFTTLLIVDPAVIGTVDDSYLPTEGEVAHAAKLVAAYEAAKSQPGSGLALLDGQILERPFYEMARTTLQNQHGQ